MADKNSEVTYQVCRFDMHPAFEGYECPFLRSPVRASCKERNCPMYYEFTEPRTDNDKKSQ